MKLKSITILLLCSTMAACTTTGGSTGGGSGGSGGTGGSGGVSGTPTDVVPATTTTTATTRKYALDTYEVPGSTRYLVGDLTKSGGQQATVGEMILGGKRYGNLTPVSGDTILQSGDVFSGINAHHDKSVVTDNPNKETVHTYNTAGFMTSTLGITDYEHARAVSGYRFETTNNEAFISMAYGGVDDAQTNNAPSVNATYNGKFGGQSIRPSGVEAIEGDLTLTANLGGPGTVSGKIDNLVITDQTGNELPNNGAYFDLGTANITGTTYKGQVVFRDGSDNAVGDFTTVVHARSEYHGGFYGANGEETAGAIDMTGTNDSERIDVLGVFVGQK